MAASNWRMYSSAKEFIGDGTIDLDTHTFNMALFTNLYTPDLNNDQSYDTIAANEVANGNGYTTGGVTLTGITWGATGGTATWDSDNATWNGTGAGFTFKHCVIYDVNSVGTTNALVCYCEADTATDVTIADLQTLTIQISPSGILTLSGAVT